MKAYRIRIGNKEIKWANKVELYFKTKICAEKTIRAIESMLEEGVKIKWIRDVVTIYSEPDIIKAFEELFSEESVTK